MGEWQNWSGSQQHQVTRFEQPNEEADLLNLLEKAQHEGKVVRPAGTSHSFVPFWTDDYIVSLDNMKGLIDVDADAMQATFRAGTKLHELGEPLWSHGLSMINMGDIDRQSIAGAVGTGTHGTGPTLKNISSQLTRIKLAKADGELLEIDKESNPELFRAAQVSMGSLGIFVEVTLQLMPAYYLHERNWSATVDECSDQLDELIRENRHFEFFWDPGSDTCAMKTLNFTDRQETCVPAEGEEIGPSYHIIPSIRDMKFNEIEFSVPADVGWDCFLDVRALMQSAFPKVRWPVEYRTLAADDMLISSASERETVTISAHQGVNYPFEEFFLAVENVFRRYGGRPHWGKVHTHQADELRRLYPHFDRFCEIRRHLDPEGRFLNPWLRGIFGIH